MSSQFFSLSKEIKLKYQRRSDTGNNGYVSLEQEMYIRLLLFQLSIYTGVNPDFFNWLGHWVCIHPCCSQPLIQHCPITISDYKHAIGKLH